MRLADVWVAIRADMTDVNQAFKGLESGLGGVSKNLGNVGRSLTTNVTLPILAAGGASSKLALDFERTMGQLVGLAGVPKQAIDGIREDIFALSRDVGKAPQELAEAFYFVASAGFEAGEAMEVLRVAARGSAAGLGEAQAIAQVLGGVINSYGKENIDAARAADILAEAVGRGAAEADEFAGVLPQVVPTAALLGVELEEVAGALAAMTNTGASASMAAIGLNQVFTTLLKPTDQANKTLEAFGLTAAGLRNVLESQGTVAVLRLLEQTFGDNEEAMTKVFGNVRAMRAAFSLLGLDAAQLDEIMSGVANSSGALDRAFEAIPEDVLAFDRAVADLTVEAVQLGRDVLPTVVSIFRKVADAVRSAGKWWRSLGEDTQQTIINFALFAAVAGPVLSILGKLVTVVLGAVKAVRGLWIMARLLRTAWLNIPTVLGYADVALAKAKGAFLAVRGAALRFASVLAGPVGIAIAAFALGMQTDFLGMRTRFEKDMKDMGDAANRFAMNFGDQAEETERAADRLGLDVGELRDRITKYMSDAGVGFEEALRHIVRELRGPVSDAVIESGRQWEEYQRQISGAARGGADDATEAFADLPPEIRAELEALGIVVDEGAEGAFGSVAEEAEEARKAAIDHMAAMLEGMASLFENDEQVQEAFQNLLDRMDDPYTEAERKADIFSKDLLTVIKTALDSDDPGAVAATVDLVNRMLSEFDLLEPGALASGKGVPPAIEDGMDSQMDALIDWIEENVTGEALSALSLEEARDIGIEGIFLYNEGMRSQERAAHTQGQRVADAAKQGVGSIDFTETGGAKAQEVATGMSRKHEDVRLAGWFAGIAAKGGFDSVDFTAAGAAIINELVWGINDNAWRLQAAAYNAGNQARDVFPSSEPKDPNSPFRGWTKLGGKMVGILADDMRANLSTARNAALAVAGAFVPNLTPAFAGLTPMASIPASTTAPMFDPAGRFGNTYIVNVNGVQKTVRSEQEAMEALKDLGAFSEGRLNG